MNREEKLYEAIAELFEGARPAKRMRMSAIKEQMDKVCSILRVAKIDMQKYPATYNVALHGELFSVLYDNGNHDANRQTVTSFGVSGVINTETHYYQIQGDEDWTEEDLDYIRSFDAQLYALVSWFQLVRFVDYSKDHDQRFPLHNSTYITEIVSKYIQDKTIGKYGVAFFNIRRLGYINKQIGEKAATELMGRYYKMLENSIGEDGVVSVMGGDNSMVLFRKEYVSSVLQIARGIAFEVTTMEGKADSLIISAHVGMNMDLDECHSSMEIFNTVGVAMNEAKKSPGNKVVEYDSKIRENTSRRQFIEQIFQDALNAEEFSVHYQPKINLHDYSLSGAEALVRWKHEGTMIFPDQFIPVLEANYTIKYLDLYMLNHVCADIRKWLDEGRNVKTISVNLSRCSIEIEDLVGVITGIIDSHGVPRKYIQIELTESTTEVGAKELRDLVVGLRDANISTAVDDFGTGFSSLSLIRDFPWNVLKIDKSLLHGALTDGSRENFMFKSIIALANGLGLECIVEGVETREEVQLLKNCGCYLAQGYFFDRPLFRDIFESRLGKPQNN